MIYLDNSATTFPKPAQVLRASDSAMRRSANPGRSGHRMSLGAGRIVYSARRTAAQLFGMNDETRVILTPGCTFSLNTVIKGLLHEGDHVVVSSLEHNAVMRPLKALENRGVTFSKAQVYAGDNDRTVDSFRRCINARTKMIICTHASNVWGIRLPVERLCALAHAYGLLFVVDAAQSAGVLPLDMTDGYDAVCVAGHKGLYGPMGTGLLLLGDNIAPEELTQGGTGSNSFSLSQPEDIPDRYESGTPNLSGAAGLEAGMRFVMSKGTEKIHSYEMKLIRQLYAQLEKMSHIRLYTPMPDSEGFVAVLSFNADGFDSEEIAELLDRHGIAVRAGLHCSPCAHEAAGTLNTGAVRVSVSAFTRENDINSLVRILYGLKKQKHFTGQE